MASTFTDSSFHLLEFPNFLLRAARRASARSFRRALLLVACSGSSDVHLARVRLPAGVERSSWVQLYTVADNLRLGAATNAVRILAKVARTQMTRSEAAV